MESRGFRARGATLIEFLVALSLLFLAGFGLLQVLATSARLGARTGEVDGAQLAARTVLEEAVLQGTTSYATLTSAGVRFFPADPRLVYQIDVTELETGLKKTVVTVSRTAVGTTAAAGPRLARLGTWVSDK